MFVLACFADDLDAISQCLVQLSKKSGSRDNISVIVVFLREPSKIAAEAHWAYRQGSTMDASLDNANATSNNPFAGSNCADLIGQGDGFLLNFKQNGDAEKADEFFSELSKNGKRLEEEFDEDDDLGPETDVDAVDDVLLSPSIAAAKAIAEGVCDKAPVANFDLDNKEEKADLDSGVHAEKREACEVQDAPPLKPPTGVSREETPTPPADEGKSSIIFAALKRRRGIYLHFVALHIYINERNTAKFSANSWILTKRLVGLKNLAKLSDDKT